MSTVTPLRRKQSAPVPAPAAPRPQSAAHRRKMQRQAFAAYGIAGVALVLTVLSLSHLAAGVHNLTQGDVWHAWAMAVGIDLGFIGLELGQLCVTTETLRKQVERFAIPAVIGTLVTSAVMNAYAFCIAAPNMYVMVAACALGVAIPAMIYVLTRVSVALWLDTQR